jgi:hypothetical protein
VIVVNDCGLTLTRSGVFRDSDPYQVPVGLRGTNRPPVLSSTSSQREGCMVANSSALPLVMVIRSAARV